MKPLIKTLIGDRYNAAAVAAIVLLELLMVRAGQGALAAYAVPLFVLAAAVWLARR